MVVELFQKPKGFIESIIMYSKFGEGVNERVFENPQAMALKDESFDLVISESIIFQEPQLGFAHHFGCPSMALFPIGYTSVINHFTGGAVNPAYVPNFLVSHLNLDNILDRLQNTFVYLFGMLMYQFVYLPNSNALLHKAFPDAPPVQELLKNVSLTLINNNNALMDPVPLAPSVIEVPGIHIKPGKPLPADLEKWIEESKDGIVYFSLGTLIKTNLMPKEKQDAIFESFRKLKQRVLVKWTGEGPANAPKNCRFEKWVPQQAVLAHSKLKAFVSHGGLLSTQESVYFGAAVVAIPVLGDQHMNAATAVAKGFAVKVSLNELTTELLDAALHEVISNPK